jgi:hypothetical protein
MKERNGLQTRVRDATRAVLPPGLGVEAAPRDGSRVATFDVTIGTAGSAHRFLAGWVGGGWPIDVQRLVGLAPAVDVVYAKSLSDGARTWLASHRIGWVDEARRANISLPSGLVVVREPADVTAIVERSDRWTMAMLSAAEAILAGTQPTVEAVQAAAGISRGASANALARMEARGLLARPGPKLRGPGVTRHMVDIDAFIDDYAEAAAALRSKQKTIRLHRLWTDPFQALNAEIAPALTSAQASWALTGAAASTLLAPYLSRVTVLELYVDHELFATPDQLGDLLGARIVEKGHRIEVRPLPTSSSAHGPMVGNVHIALPARVYADLMAGGGRSAEAAQHLREVVGVGPTT